MWTGTIIKLPKFLFLAIVVFAIGFSSNAFTDQLTVLEEKLNIIDKKVTDRQNALEANSRWQINYFKTVIDNLDRFYQNILYVIGAFAFVLSIVFYSGLQKQIYAQIKKYAQERIDTKIEEQIKTNESDLKSYLLKAQNSLNNQVEINRKEIKNMQYRFGVLMSETFDKDKIERSIAENQQIFGLSQLAFAVDEKQRGIIDWFVIGLDYEDKDDYVNALDAYERSIELNPYHHAQTHFKRGMMLYYLSRFEEAIESFNNTISHYPSFEKSYLYKALSLKSLKYNTEALNTLEGLLNINPDSLQAQDMLKTFNSEFTDGNNI